MNNREKTLEHRAMENAYILLGCQLEWIEDILDGKKVDDFALSFNIVRRVYDLKKAYDDEELAKMPDFSKTLDNGT